MRRFASRVPPPVGLLTPAALPHVSGFPARGVLWRLRHPAPRGAAGDPIFPCRQTYRARRRCLVRSLHCGHSTSLITQKVRSAMTLPGSGKETRKISGEDNRALRKQGFSLCGEWRALRAEQMVESWECSVLGLLGTENPVKRRQKF